MTVSDGGMPAVSSLPDDSGLVPALEEPLLAIEAGLSALSEALRSGDGGAIELRAASLHRALVNAVDRFTHAARAGQVPLALRRRLANASGQVAAQRESLARATAALDRAIDVLLPREGASSMYGAQGGAERSRRGGSIQA